MSAPLQILKDALEHKKAEIERLDEYIEESANTHRQWVERKARVNIEIIELEDFIAGSVLAEAEVKA